jgi:hypothetical protein
MFAAVALLGVAWSVWNYEHTNPYLKDSPGSVIPSLLGSLGAYLAILALVDSSERIRPRAARAAHAGPFGAAVVLACALVVVVRGGPPQSGLWLVFGGPLGYIMGAVIGFIRPLGRRAKEG